MYLRVFHSFRLYQERIRPSHGPLSWPWWRWVSWRWRALYTIKGRRARRLWIYTRRGAFYFDFILGKGKRP